MTVHYRLRAKNYTFSSTVAALFFLYWLLNLAIWQFDTTNTNTLHIIDSYGDTESSIVKLLELV